jgi:HEAT repeat protein
MIGGLSIPATIVALTRRTIRMILPAEDCMVLCGVRDMPAEAQNPNDVALHWIDQLRASDVDDGRWNEAVAAIKELGFFVVPVLIESLDDSNLSVRIGISKALRQKGPTVLYEVIDALVHDSSTIRREAASFLTGTASQRETRITNIVPVLIDALSDRESSVRVRAAQALCLLAERAQLAVPALIEALKDEESYVRQWVATALGSIGPSAEEAIPSLTESLLDDDEFVRDEASRALDAIRRERGAQGKTE